MGFEAKASRWRIIRLVLGALAFVVAGAWMIGAFGPPPSTRWWTPIAGWAAILFFGVCAVAGARRLFQSGVEIRVDANGIYWSRWSARTIPWSAVAGVSVAELYRQRLLCLVLQDPDGFPSVRLAGKLARANKSMGFGDISLSTAGTDKSFDELVAAIDHFAPFERA